MQPPPPVAERPAAAPKALPDQPRSGRETALLIVQSALLLAMTASVATRFWSDHVWFGWLLIGLAAAAFVPELRRGRDRRWWFVYVAGIFAYTILRSYADETWIPVRTEYVIRLDEWLPGPSPVRLLQEVRLERNFPAGLDFLAIAIHWSFFLAPHAGAAAVFLFRRSLFRSYAGLMVLTVWLGLVLFFLLPTTPPWLAAQQGELDGVTRVMDSTIRETLGDDAGDGAFPGRASTYDDFYAALGEPNSVAAMPSIHMAVTVAMYLWARRFAPRFALPLLAYSIAMAVALAYLGEHYIADEVAGVAVALLAWAVTRRYWVGPSSPPQAAR